MKLKWRGKKLLELNNSDVYYIKNWRKMHNYFSEVLANQDMKVFTDNHKNNKGYLWGDKCVADMQIFGHLNLKVLCSKYCTVVRYTSVKKKKKKKKRKKTNRLDQKLIQTDILDQIQYVLV